MRVLLILVWLNAVYVVTLGRLSAADVIAGGVIAVAVTAAFAPATLTARLPPVLILRRVVRAIPLGVIVFLQAMSGALSLVRMAWRRAPGQRAGFVELPLPATTVTGNAAAALFDTLSPGSVVVELDLDRGRFVLHVLDATEADTIRAEHERRYRRYQQHVLP